MRYMNINGFDVPYPNGFALEKVPNLVNEMITMTGKTVYDVNGWKYSDQKLQWDTLLDSDLTNLLSAISDNTFPVTFEDIDGEEHTVTAVLRGRANIKTPLFKENETVWKGIAITLSFPDCYEDE